MGIDTATQLGWAIIDCIVSALIVNGIFIIYGVICSVYESRKKKKQKEMAMKNRMQRSQALEKLNLLKNSNITRT